MRVLRHVLWIALLVLALANWFVKNQWLGKLPQAAMAVLLVAVVALALWIAIDWTRGRDRQERSGQNGESRRVR